MYYKINANMSLEDFAQENEDLLYENFLQEHYNHCEDCPDHVDENLLQEFEMNEYVSSQDSLWKITQTRPSNLRIRPSNWLLKELVKKDSSYLDGVIVWDYAVLYSVWLK